jgi:hypothetical protein
MKSYTCDYALIDPVALAGVIKHAFPGSTAIWTDVDEETFEVTVYGVAGELMDELDDVVAPYCYTHPSDWDDCDWDCGFDPYMGCYTDDC